MEYVTIVYLVIFALMVLGIILTVGAIVYRDATSRGMEGLLWAAVVLCVPSFLGLLLYLFVRKDTQVIQCSACGKVVSSEYAVCPHCGGRLQYTCEKCNLTIQEDWKACPRCGVEIPENRPPLARAVVKSSKNLWILLGGLLIVPIFIMVMGIILFRF